VPRFEAGDGLRGLAALSIVVWHALAFTLLFEPELPVRLRPGFDDLPAWLVDALPQLRDAVWVFFALSGYLLARPFVARVLHGGARPSLRRYARNRVLRIVPAFWAVVVLALLVRGRGDDGPREVLALLLFGQLWIGGDVADELSHLWSLSVEAAFYLALPLAVLVPRARSAWPVAAGVLLLGALSLLAQGHVAREGELAGVPPGTPPVLLATLGAAFVPGVLLAVVERPARRRLHGRRTGPLAGALLVVALLAAVVDTGVPQERVVLHQVLLTTLGGSVVAAALVREWSGARPWRPLVARTTRWLGERSYSLFLVHLLVLDLLIEAGAGWAAALTLGVALSLGAAWALHAAVEAPMLRLRAPRAGGAAPRAASSSASPR
jgi:peptidoglycan/LPS O-acetylase OafA/YrhL